MVVGGLLLLIVVAIGAIYAVTQRRFNAKLAIAGHNVTIPTDSFSVARGQHLATAIAKCAGCHGQDFGGQLFVDAGPVMKLYALNLTRGKGGTGAFTDLDWERAIRHGVAPDGRKLLFMPSIEFQHFNDQDFGALVAYLKTLPSVDLEFPKSTIGPIGRALYLKGDLPLMTADDIQHDAAPPPVVQPAASVEYGRYIVSVGGCEGCHGPTLSGGHIPGTPPEFKPAANITPEGIGHYTEADFFRALREGKRPAGTMLDTAYMPVAFTKLMTDDETRAVYMYLKTVPKKAFGGR
jgi:mono/diheme cytochrome c family protein